MNFSQTKVLKPAHFTPMLHSLIYRSKCSIEIYCIVPNPIGGCCMYTSIEKKELCNQWQIQLGDCIRSIEHCHKGLGRKHCSNTNTIIALLIY